MCQPVGRKLRLTWKETLSFLVSPSETHCKIEGIISVDNPLANDMVLHMDPFIRLEPGEHVPWDGSTADIPIQLGHYTLATYESDQLPFDITIREGKITIVWKSSSLSEESHILKCQLRIPLNTDKIISISKLTLDPPTLSHVVSFDSSLSIIKWDFLHLVAATQYSISLPADLKIGECSLEFQLDNCLVSGLSTSGLAISQRSTGISAEHQLEIAHHSITSSSFHIINFS
jgi:hypothetical protein